MASRSTQLRANATAAPSGLSDGLETTFSS